MREAEEDIDLPPLHGYELIIEYLEELGFVNRGYNGAIPLTFSDVKDWTYLTGKGKSTSIPGLLVKLSRAYSAQVNTSTDDVTAPDGGDAFANHVKSVRVGMKTKKALRTKSG